MELSSFFVFLGANVSRNVKYINIMARSLTKIEDGKEI